MSPTVEKIRGEIAELTPNERIDLWRALGEEIEESRDLVEAAWSAEEEDRANGVMSGKVELKSYEDLTARLNAVRVRYTA